MIIYFSHDKLFFNYTLMEGHDILFEHITKRISRSEQFLVLQIPSVQVLLPRPTAYRVPSL